MAKKKLYYKIGEACKLLDIQPYVLRYWETEFPALSPSKSKSGQRVYGETDFDVIRRIKELLYEEGFTIAGAKKRLDAELAGGGVPSQAPAPLKPAATEGNGKPEVEAQPEKAPSKTQSKKAPAKKAAAKKAATKKETAAKKASKGPKITKIVTPEPAAKATTKKAAAKAQNTAVTASEAKLRKAAEAALAEAKAILELLGD